MVLEMSLLGLVSTEEVSNLRKKIKKSYDHPIKAVVALGFSY